MRIPTQNLLITTSLIFLSIFCSCKKTTEDPKPPVIVEDTTVVPGVDPATAATIGFFLDDWQGKSFTAPAYNETAIPTATGATINVDASAILTKIPVSVFGHNEVWWSGPVAGNPQFIDPIKNLNPHILRFPGGSSSDAYFWNAKQDQNPSDAPAQLMNADGNKVAPGYSYGMTDYNWICSLDNYYTMLGQTHCKGLITVNYGYARYGTGPDPVAAAAHLAADWVRYDKGRTELWEIGNENFGSWEWGYRIDKSVNQDGQPEYLTGALYARHFKVFVDSMQKAANEIGAKIKIGAVAVEAAATESWQTTCLKTWNAGMMPGCGDKADFYVVHNYFTPYNTNSTATQIYQAAATVPKTMMDYLKNTLQANGCAIKPVVLDEWNMFATGAMQQVSNVSGGFAITVLGELLKNNYGLATRWDLINGWQNGNDHGLFSPGDEPGVSKWSPRPSFYYLYYFQKMLGDRLVSATTTSSLYAFASTYSSGQLNVTIVNPGAGAITASVKTKNFRTGNRFYWYSLEGDTDNGEFSRKVIVNGSGPSGVAGGPAEYASLKAYSSATTNGIKVKIPARGAVILVIDKK